jgi:glutamate formiminotransferase
VKTRTKLVLFVMAVGVCLAAIVALGGCASKPAVPQKVVENAFDGAPDWVTKGCNAYWGDKKGEKKVCGVGSIAGTRNISLARETALGRARVDIAKQLGTEIKAMVKDYQATVTGGEDFGVSVADEQYVEAVSKQVTDQTLVGVEQVDSWMGKDGTMWILAAMNMEKFAGMVDTMKGLSSTLRKAISERAEKAFDKLDEETKKPE